MKPKSIDITVAVCTWNRAALLAQTFDRLTQLEVPSDLTWELVLVDNNSSDDTLAVAARYQERLPLRVVQEAQQGLSYARNAALAAARGRYIVWTDDDVLADRCWLAAYWAAFRQYPTAVIFGGPVLPWFEGTPPEWLLSVFDEVAEAYAVRNLSCGDVPLCGEVLPFGANMAFTTDVLRNVVFDPNLGRRGNMMLGGEETTVIRQLFAEGHAGRWVPSAVVHHFLPAKRQSRRYLEAWYAGYGATLVILDDAPSGPRLLGRPRWLWREFFVSTARYCVSRRVASPRLWIRDLKRAGLARGQLLARHELDSRH